MRGADLALPIFSFNDPAPAALDTLSLHDALPISDSPVPNEVYPSLAWDSLFENRGNIRNKSILDRKSTRLNSSHDQTSYAVFCLKKKTAKTCRRSVACPPFRFNRPAAIVGGGRKR